MTEIRAIAMPTETAKKVLETNSSPGYGHPAHTAVAKGHGPCRHCLRPFRVGEEMRTLFTFNPFYKLASIPAPGPVFIHSELCERFDVLRLIEGDAVTGTVPTYRGEGHTFL